MSVFGCGCKFNCTAAAVIASVIIGVLTAFFQITGIITVTPVFLWVVFGIAVVYLAVLAVGAAPENGTERCAGLCTRLNVVLAGILGAILLAVILLAVGITATSVISAILVGLLLFFFALTLTGTACLVKCLFGCGS